MDSKHGFFLVYFWFFLLISILIFVCPTNHIYKENLPCAGLQIPGWILLQLPAARLDTGPASSYWAGYRSSCQLPGRLPAGPDTGRIPIWLPGRMPAARLAAGPAAGKDAGPDAGPGRHRISCPGPSKLMCVALEVCVS